MLNDVSGKDWGSKGNRGEKEKDETILEFLKLKIDSLVRADISIGT